MLCTRPYLEYRETQRIKEQGYHGISNGGHHGDSSDGDLTAHETDDEDGHGNGHAVEAHEEEQHEEHDMGEIIIHQVIREFGLLVAPGPSE